MLDERTDVFAFGMLMYAMFTGRRPLKELEEQELMIRCDRHLPGRIKHVILNCIAEDKESRYKDMQAILKDLTVLKGRRDNALRLKLTAAAAVLCMGLFGAAAVKYVVAEPRDDVADRMISEANGHIKDGEYTEEGIRIICGYIESGCLEEDICERFTYEVARNYFSLRRNYREALRYFEMLDTERYPEADYYIRLCRLQVSFEEDNEKYLKCLKEFCDYNKGLGYEESRYRNDLMIANLYDALSCRDEEGRKEEIAFLEAGLADLRYATDAGLYKDEEARYESEYLRRLCILCEDAGDDASAVKYGERALELMPESKGEMRKDIEGRLKEMRDK